VVKRRSILILRRIVSWLIFGRALLLPSMLAAQTADTLRIDGLEQPVEILKDRWGISHIYAQSEADLFFAQGWNAARDRLFQLEVWRRQATGTLAEVLGPREVERDIAARLLRFRGDLEAELEHYHPRGDLIIRAFVRGVNVYIAQARKNPANLPIEFRLLRWLPEPWTPEVVISRHGGLVSNIREELSLGRAVAELGPDLVKEHQHFHPGDPSIRLDSAITRAVLDPDILRLYNLYKSGVRFRSEDLDRAGGAQREEDLQLRTEIGVEGIGSNNWVVSGELTSTGKPFMANDPHRAQAAPSLRYLVHLVAPGWNVIGAGEPAIPGVSIGHNEHGAWGLTVFALDSEDLYVYRTNPENPQQYRYRDAWEDMRIERETIRVEGQEDVVAELAFTRHGPVLHRDSANHIAYALRAAWLDMGAAPYLASLRMDQARTWEEFREACSYSRLPGENMVWADTAGNIGWQAVGVAPLRANWSGLVPVPGDGRFEWEGYLQIPDLPHVFNPGKGFYATANENQVDESYPHRRAIGWSWSPPYRGDRIDEVLAFGRRHTVMDMMRLQHDELSIPARTLVPLLESLRIEDAGVRSARDRLLAWDYVLDRNSIEAGIHVAWERRLTEETRKAVVPEAVQRHFENIPLPKVVDWLLAPDGRFGADPIAGRDSVLITALFGALEDLRRDLGPNEQDWVYGQPRYKHALIRHPMSAALPDSLRARFDVGPVARGGYSYTVNATGNGNNQTSGASFRIIADLASWDRTVATNTPGQHGEPDDPHYRDLFPLWAENRYFPLLYSRDGVETATAQITLLSPR
jgi:penicillin amidase